MIEERAIVIEASGETARLEALRRGSSCSACAAGGACGISLLDRVLGRRPLRLTAANAIGARAGEVVVVGMPEGALLRAAVSAYLLPLAGLLLGAAAGAEVTAAPETASLIGGIAGFVAALLAMRAYGRRLALDPRFRAVILRRDSATETIVTLR